MIITNTNIFLIYIYEYAIKKNEYIISYQDYIIKHIY